MVKSQPDYDQPIQDVLSWKKSQDTWKRGCRGPDNKPDCEFIPKSTLEAEFNKPGKVEGLLEALFVNWNRPTPDADYIRSRYIRPFVILLCVGHGRMIHHFVEHESLQDRHLPFRSEPEEFPSSTTPNIWASFDKEQWGFCPIEFEYSMSNRLGKDDILPIVHKEDLGEGGSATTHKIVVQEDYNCLNPCDSDGPDSNHPRKNVFVIKTYRTSEARTYFETERNAFMSLRTAGRPPPNIIGFYGSFFRGETFNIILEYADLGNLEDFMQRVQPPSSIEDIITFWDRFFDVTHGLVTIHGTQEGNPKEPRSMLGWHQDVTPKNILVISRPGESPYDSYFKIADLGISHFQKYMGLQRGATDRDAFGTQAYGAPETYRADVAIEECQLQVKQDVDIWSMGCVYSEVTTWVGHGWNKVLEYRRRRRTEFKEKVGKAGDCFHDGVNMLDTVKQIHYETLTNHRVNDYVMSSVLKDLIGRMMLVNQNRLLAKSVYEESKRIIRSAKTRLGQTTYNIIQHDVGRYPPDVRPPEPMVPPNLPPGQQLSAFIQDPSNYAGQRARLLNNNSPHMTERAHDFHSTPVSGLFPYAHSHSRNTQYENLHFHGYQSNGHSGDQEGPRLAPPRPDRSLLYQRHAQNQVQERQRTFATPDERQNEPLHNNRFSVTAESGLRTLGGSQALRRRNTRNLPLQEPLRSSSDHADHGPFRSSVVVDPSSPLTLGPIAFIPHRQSYSYGDPVAVTPIPRMRAPIQRPPPVLTIKQGLKWKRDKEFGRNSKLNDKELLNGLKGRDHVFLVDDAASMAAYWPQVRRVFELITYMVRDCDPNGLDLYFTSSPKKLNAKDVTLLLKELDMRRLKGFTDMRERFGDIIEKYQDNLRKKAVFPWLLLGPPRKLSLYVFTDAVWQPKCDLKKTVKALVRSLGEYNLTNKQVGIQFIRYGNDQEGIRRLEELDSELDLELDIVDTTPADGNVWKMLNGSVNDWFDDD